MKFDLLRAEFILYPKLGRNFQLKQHPLHYTGTKGLTLDPNFPYNCTLLRNKVKTINSVNLQCSYCPDKKLHRKKKSIHEKRYAVPVKKSDFLIHFDYEDKISIHYITTHIHNLWEGNVFRRVCLSTEEGFHVIGHMGLSPAPQVPPQAHWICSN